MNKIKFAFFLILFATGILNAQDELPKTIPFNKHSISLKLIGAPTWPLGVTYGQMVTDRLSMEVGMGIYSLGAGFEYYITNPRIYRFNLNTGLYGSMNFGGYPMFYLPLGISYFDKNSFQYNLNAGILYAENVSFSGNEDVLSPWFGLTISKRFGLNIEDFKILEKTSKKNIISLSFFGMTPFVGVTYERLLTPFLGFDVGLGLPSIGAGIKLYLPEIREDHWNFHLGASQHFFVMPWAGGWKTYFPIGLSRISENGFRISFDLGPQIGWYRNSGDLSFNGNLRIGRAY